MGNNEEVKKCISNLKTLSADTEKEYYEENYRMTKIKLESIEYWSKKCQKALKKIMKESENNATIKESTRK